MEGAVMMAMAPVKQVTVTGAAETGRPGDTIAQLTR
jgi:hypothetical protein